MKNTYLVVNTSYFGDVLLTSNLIQNIKDNDPHGEIIFLANTPFVAAAQSLTGVDQVLSYDKKQQHKGLKGMWKFYKAYKAFFAQRNLVAAFIIYGNERGICLAKLWGAQKIYSDTRAIMGYFLHHKLPIDYQGETKVAHRHAHLYKLYANTVKNYPMHWSIQPDHLQEATTILTETLQSSDLSNLIALCPVSKKTTKDLPLNMAVDIIENLATQGKTVLLLGAGDVALNYQTELSKHTDKFCPLVNKTTLHQLAGVLKLSQQLISVDTGTMHLGLALAVPTTCLFFINDPKHIAAWAPTKEYYHCKVLIAPITSTDILEAVTEL